MDMHYQKTIDEVVALVINEINTDYVFELVLAFVENKYQAELKDVNNLSLKQHIIEQRLPAAFEECGILDVIVKQFSEFNFQTRLEQLRMEETSLQSEVHNLNEKINFLVENMTKLQISSFGRVLRLFDNRIIDLAKDEEELMLIEKPTLSKLENESTGKSVWRTLQPSELLLGLRLTIGQPVLYRKRQHSWFPGRVMTCQCDSVSKDLNKPVANQNFFYSIKLDSSSQDNCEVCLADSTSLALAISASELKQKYPVGARVVSIYRDELGGIGYYSGLIAEPPSERNSHRYLLFFDDGYTQYSVPNEVYRICHQSKENWREATTTSQEFIKRYLAQYPQRPMVRLKPDQVVETELDGEWIQATVEKVDASLVLMKFSDTHSEWIYRGSTRLEPLFSDMFPGQNSLIRSVNKTVEVECNDVEASLSSGCKRRKARKSATGKQLDVGKSLSTPKRVHVNMSYTDLADLELVGVRVPYLDDLFKKFEYKKFVTHKCGLQCLDACHKPINEGLAEGLLCSHNPLDYKGLNPLEIPFQAGWLRFLYNPTSNDDAKSMIVYSAPCGRRLGSMHELERFLDCTNCQLTTDLFTFDTDIVINREFRAEKTLTNIADLSYGKENIPVQCVNSVDNEVPSYIDYIPQRQPVGNVPLNNDANFMVCCDCTDNCRDRSKCACQQLTIESSSLTNLSGMVDSQAGYRYRRLSQFTVGGIYECNAGCQCDRRCSNRVVQQGLWTKLQVFKTSRKGWGIRALHAIPKGAFICIYAGAVYDETMAVQEGFDYGDEYQAELDYIETVEKEKEGYESTVDNIEIYTNESLVSKIKSLLNNTKRAKPSVKNVKHRTRTKRRSKSEDSFDESTSTTSSSSSGGSSTSSSNTITSLSDDDQSATRQSCIQSCALKHSQSEPVIMGHLDETNNDDATVVQYDDKPIEIEAVGDVNQDTASAEPGQLSEITNNHDATTRADDLPAELSPTNRDTSLSVGQIDDGEQATLKSDDDDVDKDDTNVTTVSSPNRIDEGIDLVVQTDSNNNALGQDDDKHNGILDLVQDVQESDAKEDIATNSRTETDTLDIDKIKLDEPLIETQNDDNHVSLDPTKVSTRQLSCRPKHQENLTTVVGNRFLLKHHHHHRHRHHHTLTEAKKRLNRLTIPEQALRLSKKFGPILKRKRFAKDPYLNRIPIVQLLRIKAPKPEETFNWSVLQHDDSKFRNLLGPTKLSRLKKETIVGGNKSNLKSLEECENNDDERAKYLRKYKCRRSISNGLRSTNKKSCYLRRSHQSYDDRRADGKHRRHHHHHHHHRHQQQQQHRHDHLPNQSNSSQSTKRAYPIVTKDWLHVRSYFDDINPYIMDAKKMGNVGRYFNHSCNPNVFVQNVFIHTHDQRFPEVAFFAKRNIEVGEEMTWDYGYTVDAVPFKVLYCYCGEPNCRIRLL